MRVLEDQLEGGDVLVVHALAAAHLDGVLDALVDLLGGGLARVGQLGQGAIGEGGQDLEAEVRGDRPGLMSGQQEDKTFNPIAFVD